jgi:Peptidase C13 family
MRFIKKHNATLVFFLTLFVLTNIIGCDRKSLQIAPLVVKSDTTQCKTESTTTFLVLGGGGAPSYNEIALEKNLLYFQRSLCKMGYTPKQAKIFFANGNNGEATIRYIDEDKKERYKPPSIPDLNGSSTYRNLKNSLLEDQSMKPLFFYFTGHGLQNKNNNNDNSIILWNKQYVSVKQLAKILDQMPSQKPFVTMMSQCYSGSFTNLIYKNGDRIQPIAKQRRCGFFATIKTLPSVGCTPEVDEADYQDYSSSFYAGLTGVNRVNQPVPSADYNSNGKISYNEAHAYAKIDDKSTDLPISTSEAWLQDRESLQNRDVIVNQPIASLLVNARPEQRFVVNSMIKLLNINSDLSFTSNKKVLIPNDETQYTYLERLRMELTNIFMERQIRKSGDRSSINIIDRLVECESGSWENDS